MNVDLLIMYGTIFIIGLVLGSFYNVVALRTLSGESLAFPASHCTTCEHQLHLLDLVPVFSWLFLRGKCRYCGAKISPIYPIGELLTASSYTLIFHYFVFTMEALIQAVFITIMIWATMTDLKATMVPDRFVVIGLISVLSLRLISGGDIIPYLIAAAVSFSAMFLLLILSGGKMGGADVKLYSLIGLSIGLQDAMGSLFYAAIIALIFQIPIIIANKGVDREKQIPFVPFITLGVLATYVLDIFVFV